MQSFFRRRWKLLTYLFTPVPKAAIAEMGRLDFKGLDAFPVDLAVLFWDDDPEKQRQMIESRPPISPFSNHRNPSHIEGGGKWYDPRGAF